MSSGAARAPSDRNRAAYGLPSCPGADSSLRKRIQSRRRGALSGFRIDGRDDEQTIETRIGLHKALGPVEVSESTLSRARDGFGCARDSHYLVPSGTLQQFRNDSSPQMAAGPTYTDFHVNLQCFSLETSVGSRHPSLKPVLFDTIHRQCRYIMLERL